MTKQERYFRGLLGAWELLIDFPLPQSLADRLGKGVDATSKLVAFPLVGAAVGILLALAAEFCSKAFNPVAGNIIFACLGAVFLELKDSGRGQRLLLALITAFRQKRNLASELPGLVPERSRSDFAFEQTFSTIFQLVKVTLLFVLAYYSAKLWFAAMLIGAFTVQGILAMEPDNESGHPILPVPAENRRFIWFSAGVLTIPLLFCFPLATFLGIALVYFSAAGLAGFFRRNYSGVTPNLITLAGYLTEFALLILGILLALTIQ